MKNSVKSATLGKFIINILFIIICVLLIFNFARKLGNNTDLSFSGFLTWLGNVDSFNIQVNISSFTIGGDWGWFDGLRNFFNIFANLFGVLVYLCSNLINLIIFIGQFLVFMFVV